MLHHICLHQFSVRFPAKVRFPINSKNCEPEETKIIVRTPVSDTVVAMLIIFIQSALINLHILITCSGQFQQSLSSTNYNK